MADRLDDPLNRKLFDIGRSWGEAHFDETTALVGSDVRGSAAFALFLAASGDGAAAARSERIVAAVVAQQEQDPSRPDYGLFKVRPDAPATTDANWAAFCGSYLMHIPRAYGDRIGEAARRAIEGALERACAYITKRDVSPRYTNIALLSASVLTVAGGMYGWSPVVEEGRRKVREFLATLNLSGGFCEYTSPTYYGTNFSALCWMTMFASDEEIREAARRIQARLWRTVAAHYHRPTGQIAGPYSRAYGNILQRYAAALKYYLHKALGKDFDLGESAEHGWDTSYAGLAALQDVACPEDAAALMRAGALPRTVVEAVSAESRLEKGYAGTFVQMTTVLTPAFALGTVNTAEGWAQRRNVMLHWNSGPGQPAALWEEVRENDVTVRGLDHRFWSVQSGSRVLVLHDLSATKEKTLEALTVALAAEGARMPDVLVGNRKAAEFPASFGGNDTIALRLGDLAVGLKFCVGGFPDGRAAGTLRATRPGFEAAIDLYRGPGRTVAGPGFRGVCCAYAMEVEAVGSDKEFATFAARLAESEVRKEAGEAGVSVHWRTETTALTIRPRGDGTFALSVDGRSVEPRRLFEDDL